MMNRREELNVEMMEQVNGGTYFHETDGGILDGVDSWGYVNCSKCGEEYYWTSSFKNVIYFNGRFDDEAYWHWEYKNGESYSKEYTGDRSLFLKELYKQNTNL